MPSMKITRISSVTLFALFLVSRLALLAAMPLDGLRGYGDFIHFFRLAGMGWPFLDYWVEFPPIFPFLSTILYRLSGAQEHIYDYYLALLLSLCQAASLVVFDRLVIQGDQDGIGRERTLAYFLLSSVLAYGWWYFDPLAVLAMLLGLYWLMRGKDTLTGAALGIGTLVKLFPALALVSVWRYRPLRRSVWIGSITIGMVLTVYGGLYLLSPRMTFASIISQASKGSWETIWALLDGNFHTGNFGQEIERYEPAQASLARGEPARVPPYLALILFVALGFWVARRIMPASPQTPVVLYGFTLNLFFLWSPGWSPQWVQHLLPLILLSLPIRQASLFVSTLVLINLLEWPVLLSRGLNWGLWVTVPIRTLILILLAITWYRQLNGRRSNP